MGMRLYVGNLSYSVTSQSLEAAVRRSSARSRALRSFRIVTPAAAKALASSRWSTTTQARAAIEGLNLKEVEGRC